MKPHKHAELIKAWADGAEIERYAESLGTWFKDEKPSWSEDITYRIKKEAKGVKYYEAEMAKLIDGGDTEADHGEADDLLCHFLRELGYEDLVSIYHKVHKWYA